MQRKYTYPPDDELVRLFKKHRTYSAVGKLLDIPRNSLKSHVRYQPALLEAVRDVTEGVKEQHSGRPAVKPMEDRPEVQKPWHLRSEESKARTLNRERLRNMTSAELLEHKRKQRRESAARNKATTARYVAAHREQYRIYAKLGAAKRKAAAQYTPESRSYISLILNDPCAYCGSITEAVDHIEPVSGGGDSTAENLAPTCRSCNSVKSTKSLLEFLLHRCD